MRAFFLITFYLDTNKAKQINMSKKNLSDSDLLI